MLFHVSTIHECNFFSAPVCKICSLTFLGTSHKLSKYPFYFQFPDITYKVLKVLRWGHQFSKIRFDILCFLHVSKVPESEKGVFENGLSVCPSVYLSVVTLQPKRKELRTSNLVHNLLVFMGHDSSIFEKIAHAQRVPAVELFGF